VLRIRDVSPGSRFLRFLFILDTGPWNPDTTTAIKEKRGKIYFPKFFISHKYHKIKNYFIFELVKEKNLGQFL
jgi:hypothetical protein